MRSQPPSGDSLGRVTCDPFVLPPSGGIPYAVAMPSMMVDLPLPFSPTRKVTPCGSSKPSRSNWATAGIDAGQTDGSKAASGSA